MLIGRQKEQERLRIALSEEESMFVAVYGRRRVGKTYLVREMFGKQFTFYHTGLAKSPMKKQLAAWRSSLRDYGMKKATLPRTWLDAFDMLKDLVQESSAEKKILFIDEMPWMDTQRSGFIPALEHFWNGWASARKDIVLIICGSATSWIINNVIKNHGGLHNRVNMKIHLQPFTLHECELYANHRRLGMNRWQLMECYMIMGGIPFYWSKLERANSLAQNIDNLFFAQDGELQNEFGELYASLFKNPEPYIRAVNTLGTKRIGMTREELIEEKGFSDNGQLTRILEDLEACGFIRKYSHFGTKTKHAQYQLIDSYTLFYYKYILSNHLKDEHFWSAQMGSPIYYNWCGLAFERVCLLHLSQIKKALGISGIISNAFSWFSRPEQGKQKGAQIDLVIDRSDNVVDLCEIKYTKEPYEVTREEEEKVQNRRSRFLTDTKTNKAVHLILISANDVVPNSYSYEFQSIISADALFSE
ncbi:MAG: ATP-binding protein [Parabacteroides sp.]|nr:AAA family ATPase [Parabacteroides sp.]MDY4845855.1 ATP-binding protein [Parabacteroides sp.]MDY5638883.1 ATP-binding protein [Parabacteroides sp.]